MSELDQPSAKEVTRQLERILRDPAFVRSPTISKLLHYLVEEELEGRGDRLKGYTVGIEALGKQEDFDPSTDAGVRVEASRLRRMMTAYYSEAMTDTIKIELPKGSYRPQFSNLQPSPLGPLEKVIAPSSGPSVALLSFDLSSDDLEIFAIGVRQELLSELFRYREFQFMNASGVDPGDHKACVEFCRDELECEFMVGIGVHRKQDQIVLTGTVTDLNTNQIIWVDQFNAAENSPELLELANTLAVDISSQLAKPSGILPLSAMQKRFGRAPAEWSACDCILRWHFYRLRNRSREAHAALTTQVKRILQDDPLFGMGYVICAMLSLDELVYRLNYTGDDQKILERARFYAAQSVARDNSNALAHYVKAQCHYFAQDVPAFRESINTAISLHPNNPDLLHHAGAFYCFSGDWDTGLALLDRADMRYHSGIGYRLAFLAVDYFRGDDPSAGALMFETAYVPPELSVAQILGALLYAKNDELDKASECLRRAHSAESSLSRNLSELAELWFIEPQLRDQMISDASNLSNYTGIVVNLK